MPYDYTIISSHDDGYRKVVEVVVREQRPEGATEERVEIHWYESERYKDTPSGKVVPKTGVDYKREVEDYVQTLYSPKADSPD